MSTTPTRQRILGNPAVRTVLSVWAWFSLVVTLLVWTPMVFVVWVVTTPFDRDRYWTGYVFRRICVVLQILNPLWRFRVSGEEVHDPRRPYVVVSNHESFADMFLISHLPWEMKWMSKETFFRFPLIGWMMRMSNDIRLVRGSKQSIVSAMKGAHDRLGRHLSVMIFPEGTRTTDGSLGEFKDGAFRLAIEFGCPILPLALVGTREAINKGDWRFGLTDAEVRVLAPIETAGLTTDDIPALRDRTRALIEQALIEMRA